MFRLLITALLALPFLMSSNAQAATDAEHYANACNNVGGRIVDTQATYTVCVSEVYTYVMIKVRASGNAGKALKRAALYNEVSTWYREGNWTDNNVKYVGQGVTLMFLDRNPTRYNAKLIHIINQVRDYNAKMAVTRDPRRGVLEFERFNSFQRTFR